MAAPFFEPMTPCDSRAEVFAHYLTYFRSRLAEHVVRLDESALRTSGVPSGWTPLQLVKHLTYVERRWLVWGFRGEDVGDPWGDRRDDRWFVGDDETREELLNALTAQGAVTSHVVATSDLESVGAPGARWDGAAPPTLERILFHLVQEYARHLGHLDIVVELSGGGVGE